MKNHFSWGHMSGSGSYVVRAAWTVVFAVVSLSTTRPLGAQSANPYARYATPGWCQAALTRLHTIYWRDKREDTVVYAPLTDSVPASIKHTLASCAARFTVENTPEHELVALVQLDLALGKDDQARAAAERLIANHASDAADRRAWVLLLVARSFLDAKPARLDDGRRYVARLDSLGAPAGELRVAAHVHYGEFDVSTGDLAAADTQYQAAIAASKAMSRDERTNDVPTLFMMYDSASEVSALHHGAPEALRLIESAKTELVPLRPPGTPGAVGGALQGLTQLYTWYGQKAEALKPSHWYVTTGDTVRPTPGVTSLVILGNVDCGGRCYPQYATIRRLQAKYGSALKTTIVTGTGGYFQNNLIPEPAAESDSVGHYFLDFLKLPVGVAASDLSFTRKLDGRRNVRFSTDQHNYMKGRNAVVVGRDGTIKAIVNVGVDREKVIADLIAAETK